jgi:hypothetical protein
MKVDNRKMSGAISATSVSMVTPALSPSSPAGALYPESSRNASVATPLPRSKSLQKAEVARPGLSRSELPASVPQSRASPGNRVEHR